MGDIVLSKEEQRKYDLALQVIHGKLSIKEFSMLVGRSYRQAQRTIKKVQENKAFGVKHGNSGRAPKNKTNEDLKKYVLSLFKTKYYDFNLTHFQEKLFEEEGIRVGRETLRKWGHETRLVKRPKRRPAQKLHKPRPRLPQAGMLIQFDGSVHNWFSGNGPVCTLIGGIDDATGEIVGLEFFAGEDSLNCMKVMKDIVINKGVPKSFYMDQAGFLGRKEWAVDATQVGRALKELGANCILANTPQAKGKIERLWGTLQDRLVAELRINNINRIPSANEFLRNQFVEDFNKRFSVKARDPESSYTKAPTEEKLEDIFCIKETRKIGGGNVFSYENYLYLIDDPRNLHYRSIYIRTYYNGSKSYETMGQKIKISRATHRKAPKGSLKKIA